jgi:hypothetical protein
MNQEHLDPIRLEVADVVRLGMHRHNDSERKVREVLDGKERSAADVR